MEASQVHRRADHRGAEGARGRGEDRRSGAQAWRVGGNAVQLESEVRRHGRLRGQAAAVTRGRERQAEECRADAGRRGFAWAACKGCYGSPPSAVPSRICRPLGFRSVVPTSLMVRTARWSATESASRSIAGRVCASLRPSGGDSTTEGGSCCCDERAKPPAIIASTGSIAKKVYQRASAEHGGARLGHAHRPLACCYPSRPMAGASWASNDSWSRFDQALGSSKSSIS
jgi:hypothetical protein